MVEFANPASIPKKVQVLHWIRTRKTQQLRKTRQFQRTVRWPEIFSPRKRWVIEGSVGRAGQWVRSGGGRCGQHPAGQPDRHCSSSYSSLTIAQISSVRNRRLPFGAAHCHRQPGGSGSFVEPRRRSGKLSIAAREQIGEDDLQQGRDSTVCSRNRKCKRCVVTEIPGAKSRPVSSTPIDPLMVPGAPQRSHYVMLERQLPRERLKNLKKQPEAFLTYSCNLSL